MRARQLIAALLLLPVLAVGTAHAGPALLFDPEDGKVLYAEDPDSQWHPASLTKIMTAYLTFVALKEGKLTLETRIPTSLNATLVQPSKLGLPVGVEISVDVALQALIIKSANDVAIMLAEAVSGTDSAFVALMNATCRRLGMTRTTFVNPNGLPTQEQMTTARDLAKLSRAVVTEFPEYAHYWSKSEARIGKTLLTTHNGLLKSFEGADGMKTGFICDSGFNIVASATRDGKKLMAVVLGEQTGAERTMRAATLLEHGFQQMGWKQLFNTTTIDNMSMPPDAKGIMSMRQSVISWECGTGRRASTAQAARKARIKAARAKADGAKAAKAGTEKDAAVTNVAAPGVAASRAVAAKSEASAAPAKAATKPAAVSTSGALPLVIKPKPKASPAPAAVAAPPPETATTSQPKTPQ